MSRLLISLLFFQAVLLAQAQQYIVSGRVMDAATGERLAFVNIVVNESRQGGATDIDGKFMIRTGTRPSTLKFTYVGYETITLPLEGASTGLDIYMQKIPYELREVVILPGINPAHRIINNVIENRDLNNPEMMRSFSYTSYEKVIFTIDLDSLRMMDTLMLDTTLMEVRRFIDRHDVFIAESVTERHYLYPGKNREDVIASRISGMKDPMFVFLVSQVQSTSFYKELINIGPNKYVNPISRGSTAKYTFILEDTAYSAANDTIFIISYQPKPGTNFDGLKGLLSINTHNWAIQNVIAEPARDEGPFTIRIQQKYELIDGIQWFPVQLNTDVKIKAIGAPIEGRVYTFVGIGKSYIREIELNPELVKRDFSNIEVDVDPNATFRSEEFWNSYRVDSLSERDLRTYEFMDSIGRQINLDRLARIFETVMTGKIPVKYVDLDIDKFLRYNQYEGLYLGLGLHTSERLSKRFRLGGYFGYGFNDKTLKYGGDVSAIIHRRSGLELRAGYFYDVTESGGVHFPDEQKSFLRGEGYRNFLIRRMNMTERAFMGIQFTGLRHFLWNAGFVSDYKEAYPFYHYGQTNNGVSMLKDDFRFTEVTLGFRFAYREKFLRTRRVSFSLGTKYPVLRFQYTRGIEDLLSGEFAYDRFDLRIDESFYTKYLGMTSLEIHAGYINGDLPYCNLYNGNGSYRVFTIYAPGSFATMRMNEFLSNRYVALYFNHNFGTLLLRTRFFSPEIVVATNIAFGDLNNPEQHHDVEFNTLEKGYYESGVLLHGLLDLRLYKVGAGVFYRYGPYGFDVPAHNFAYKVSVVFPVESVRRR